MVRQWVAEHELTLHPVKTKIVDVRTEGFDFLGYHFVATHHWPRKKSLHKLKDTLRVKTRRTSGDSLQYVIASVNQTLRGWVNYFGKFYKSALYPVFSSLNRRLVRWAQKKYKRYRHQRRATRSGRRGRCRGVHF